MNCSWEKWNFNFFFFIFSDGKKYKICSKSTEMTICFQMDIDSSILIYISSDSDFLIRGKIFLCIKLC